MNRARSITRSVLRCAGITVAVLGISCSGDRPTLPGTGGILLRLSFPDAGTPRPDSLRVEIHDGDGLRLAEAVTALPASGPLDTSVEIEVDAANDLRALVQAEGGASADRGAVGYGGATGIDVVGGKTTEQELAVLWSVPDAPVVDSTPGVPVYTVRWNRVDGALSYVLRESNGVTVDDIAVTDTAKTLGPGVARGAARLRTGGLHAEASRLPSNVRVYSVRSVLPLGESLFGDSTEVDLDTWQDLPYVTAVNPGDGVSGVPDTSVVEVSFDRPMNPGSLLDTLVSLRPRDGGAIVSCARGVSADQKMTVLRPESALQRGVWYSVRVSTTVVDAEGRPLDQDAGTDGLQSFISDFRVEEYDPLRVASTEPEADAGDVPVGNLIRVRLNRAVDPASLNSSSFTLSDTSGVLSGIRRTSEQGKVLEFVPSRPLAYDVIHTIRLTPELRDAARHEPLDQDPATPGLQSFTGEFRTELQPRGPRVVWSQPLPGEALFPIYESPSVVFDRPIDPTSIMVGSNIGLQLPLSGDVWVNVLGGVQLSADSLTCVIVPSRPLTRNSRYRLLALGGTNGLRDRHGNPLDQDFQTPGFQPFTAEFLTEENVRVTIVEPANNLRDVPWNTHVRVRFSGPVRPESVADSSFTLVRGNSPLAAVLSVSSDSLEATLAPVDPLEADKTYRVRVGTGVRSRRGGSFDQNWDLEGHQGFESSFVTAPDTTSPRVIAVDPADGTRGVAIDRGIRVHFSKPIRPSTLPGYFHITARDSLGSEMAGSVSSSPDSLSAVFTPSAPLSNSTLYHVHVETWVRDRYGYRLDQDPDTYWYQKFHSVFTTEAERIPPQVVSVDPADGAEGMDIRGPVTVAFTEAMDRSSLGAGLRIEIDGASVAGTLSFTNEDRTASWRPATPLLPAKSYRVVVDSLALDLVGNRFDQVPGTPALDRFESGFRTAADTTGPNVASVDPADGSTGVQIGIHPRLTFDEPVDPTTITLGAVTLVDSTGTTVPTTQVLGGGDRTVDLVPSGNLAFLRAYRITVYPTVADTSGNPFDADPGSPGDQPFVSTFRTQNETIPPRVLAMILDDGPPAPVDTRVRLYFSEKIDPASVGDTSLVVSVNGAPVIGTRTVSASGDSATFRPAQDLEYQTTYQVHVSGVRDLHGNALDQDPGTEGIQAYEDAFTTGEDLTAPRVRRSVPSNGARGVDPGATLRLTFTEPMDSSSFTTGDPGLYLDDVAVTAVRTAQAGDSIFVFEPAVPLTRGKTYEWRAGTSLTDLRGNPLDQDAGVAGNQAFLASFEVGNRPIANAGSGVCSDGEDLAIHFDGSASSDPDGDIVRVIWDWGDGSTDTLASPVGLTTSHRYACADSKGCDGLDNDADGSADEIDADGCDESYHVRMTAIDGDGWSSTDSTGVSFCAFLVLNSTPSNGAVDVDTLATISIDLTRACNPATIDTSSVYLRETGGAKVTCTVTVENDDMRIVLTPSQSLQADTDHEIHVMGLLTSASGSGEPMDQDPCTDGNQEYVADFRTVAASPPPPGR